MIFIYPFCHLKKKDWLDKKVTYCAIYWYNCHLIGIILSVMLSFARHSVLTHYSYFSPWVPSKELWCCNCPAQEWAGALPGQAGVYLGYYDAGDNIYQKIAPGETQARIERSGLTEEARLVSSGRACCRVNISQHFAIFCNTAGQGMFWNIYLWCHWRIVISGRPAVALSAASRPALQRLQQSSSDHYSTLSYNFTATAITPTIGILSVSAVTH